MAHIVLSMVILSSVMVSWCSSLDCPSPEVPLGGGYIVVSAQSGGKPLKIRYYCHNGKYRAGQQLSLGSADCFCLRFFQAFTCLAMKWWSAIKTQEIGRDKFRFASQMPHCLNQLYFRVQLLQLKIRRKMAACRSAEVLIQNMTVSKNGGPEHFCGS